MKDTWSLQCGRSTNSNFWFILFDFDTSHVRLCEGRVSEPEWEQRRPRPLFYVTSTSQTLALVPAAWCHSYSAFNTFSIITSINWISSEYLDRCVYYIECKWQHSELCNLHHQHPTILSYHPIHYSSDFHSYKSSVLQCPHYVHGGTQHRQVLELSLHFPADRNNNKIHR